MAKILTETVKSLIIADYKTGKYSQRELSKKHDVSLGTISKITKDLEASNEHLVNAQLALLTAKEILPHEQMNAIMNTASDIARREKLVYGNAELIASKIPEMLNGMVERSVNKDTGEITEVSLMTPSDLKTLAEANDKIAITLKVADRHAKSGDVNVQANTQVNNTPIEVKFIE